VIDVHHHLVCEPGYVDRLLREMDRLGIERAGLMAMGAMFERLFVTTGETVGPLEERDALAALRTHPDRFFGYVYVRLGSDGAEKVKRWGEQGFRGVKLHIPKAPYSDEAFFPVYDAARSLGMVCLFHTGLISAPFPNVRGERLLSEYTRPVHVEAVAVEMPDLRIVLAHLGGVWAEEACGMMRLHTNVHADMSGRLDGWRRGKPPEWFRELLFWPGAADKLLFGSDVHCAELDATVRDQMGIVRALGWDERRVKQFASENARRLFGLT
jgi:predicted TIM-barrel fold metal-dependent hydrolase